MVEDSVKAKVDRAIGRLEQLALTLEQRQNQAKTELELTLDKVSEIRAEMARLQQLLNQNGN